jgi:hypothetical protein
MFNVYKNQLSRQTGSRNLIGSKMLSTIWGTYKKLVTKYQISAINSCWEKCGYMFNVYKNQLSRQTGSRNLTVPKTLPTIWYTYITLVTKYQISAINNYWEKCDEKYLGRTEGLKVCPLPLKVGHVLPRLRSWWTRWPLQRWGCLTYKCVYIVCFFWYTSFESLPLLPYLFFCWQLKHPINWHFVPLFHWAWTWYKYILNNSSLDVRDKALHF